MILILFMLLSPPAITETHRNERIEFSIPNGYGINGIRINVPKGKEAEGLEQAEELLSILHGQVYIMRAGRVTVTLRASSQADAYDKIKKWIRIIGNSH